MVVWGVRGTVTVERVEGQGRKEHWSHTNLNEEVKVSHDQSHELTAAHKDRTSTAIWKQEWYMFNISQWLLGCN